MPRFVVLEHDHPFVHWDIMLEQSDGLRTWRLMEPPCHWEPIAAEPTFLHRSIYLDYEGPVSGGRGTVHRWDAGVFDWQCDQDDRVTIRWTGARVSGRAELYRSDAGWTFQLLAAGDGSSTG